MPEIEVQHPQRNANLGKLCVWFLCGILLFGAYTFGIPENPPGFYLDESVLSYNAYLVSQTCAGESGVAFPLYFPVYTDPYEQYANPTHIYLLAAVFKLFGPGIMTARVFAALCVFAACILLGLLGRSISGSNWIGTIVGGFALITPWMYEVGRIVLETFFYPLAVVFLLWAVYRASLKERWTAANVSAIVAALALLTYSYTIGRLLGPLLAFGLAVFATSRARLFSILRVWLLFGLTLIPLAVYVYQNPMITERFRVLSYLEPEGPVIDTVMRFAGRLVEDLNPVRMLIGGDINPRHHLPGFQGSFYIGIFVLSVLGLLVIVARYRREPFWRYVIFGTLASVVPAALTNDPFHTLRMVAYPIFLLLLTVPALAWLFGYKLREEEAGDEAGASTFGSSESLRHGIAAALLTMTVVQAGVFLWRYHREGGNRGEYFDAGYKILYDEAVAQPQRPIYLIDGYWGPAYIHAFWYATLEGRSLDEFVHVPYRETAPDGALVLSSEKRCRDCRTIAERDGFRLYIREEGNVEIEEPTER